MIKDFKANLQGKTVVVTGASRGIGKAISLAFARHACRIVMISRSETNLDEAAGEVENVGAEVLKQCLDVADEQAILVALQNIRDKWGRVDILINNAGIYKSSPVVGHQSKIWHEVINTNLTAAFVFCRELAQPMVDSGWGRIVNISSISGKHAEMQGAAYSASKFGLIGLTQSLALELAPSAVTVNAICPGWVNTDMAREQLGSPEWCKLNSINPDDSMEIARMSVPQMRLVEPEEVAELAVYLCGESARAITGQAINICGGMCMS